LSGVAIGERADAKEAGRFGCNAGEPAWDTVDCRRETGRSDLRDPVRETGRGMLDLNELNVGVFLVERRGVDAREGSPAARSTRTHSAPLSVCSFFDGRGGVSAWGAKKFWSVWGNWPGTGVCSPTKTAEPPVSSHMLDVPNSSWVACLKSYPWPPPA